MRLKTILLPAKMASTLRTSTVCSPTEHVTFVPQYDIILWSVWNRVLFGPCEWTLQPDGWADIAPQSCFRIECFWCPGFDCRRMWHIVSFDAPQHWFKLNSDILLIIQFRNVLHRNAPIVQIAYTLNRVAELIYNGSDSNASDALFTCLLLNSSCSDTNDTLDSIQTELSCIIDLNSSSVLNETLISIVNEIAEKNATAFNASNFGDCNTL